MSQYIIKEIMNMTFLDFATQTPIAYADYAETTEIDNTASRVDIQGGQGGYLLGSIDWNKRSTLNLKLPLVDASLLAVISGDTLATGAQNLFKREVLTVNGGSASLSETPVAGTTPYVAVLVGTRDFGQKIDVVQSAPSANQCTISGKDITFGSGVADGSKVCVVYQYATPNTTSSYSMVANQQVKTMTIIGEGFVLDQVNETIIGTNIIIHKCKPQPNFKLTMDMKTPTTLDLKFDMYPVVEGNKYKYYDFGFLT
jgi:hypothetical protein